jgi:hypothetical protein
MFPGLTLLILLGGHHRAPHPEGYLVAKQGVSIAYEPREGDLVFYDDHSKVWTALFQLAGTGPPLHMGIVVRKFDGVLAVLEAGPDDTIWVDLRDLVPRLHRFQRDFNGTITIRRSKVALNRFQSHALSRFARAQNGKRYAVLRLLAQGTPLRSRGPLEPWLGRTSTDRDSWICSELSVASATVVGLLDPDVVHANSVYPRDLVDNQRFDLSASWHDAADWQPHVPRTGLRPRGSYIAPGRW